MSLTPNFHLHQSSSRRPPKCNWRGETLPLNPIKHARARNSRRRGGTEESVRVGVSISVTHRIVANRGGEIHPTSPSFASHLGSNRYEVVVNHAGTRLARIPGIFNYHAQWLQRERTVRFVAL